jgi:hypothetical protein
VNEVPTCSLSNTAAFATAVTPAGPAYSVKEMTEIRMVVINP